MKAKPLRLSDCTYHSCTPEEATHILLHLPGPLPNRIIPVMIKGTREGTGNWTWNGNVDFPTLKPSVRSRGRDEKGEHICHTWITDGKAIFLSDCNHEFAGQILDLLDVEY